MYRTIPTLMLAGVCLLAFAGTIAGAARASRTCSPTVWTARPLGTKIAVGGLVVAAGALTAPESSEGEAEPTHEGLYKVINFVILVVALGYLLRKSLADFFAQRSEAIRKSLEEGRRALEASQAQIHAIEEKLRGLEEEIVRFKAESAKEMDAERERLRQTAAKEAERILEFARAQIASATRAAKLELKAYAAREAVDLAEQAIRQRLDDAGRRHLVERFVRELSHKPN